MRKWVLAVAMCSALCLFGVFSAAPAQAHGSRQACSQQARLHQTVRCAGWAVTLNRVRVQAGVLTGQVTIKNLARHTASLTSLSFSVDGVTPLSHAIAIIPFAGHQTRRMALGLAVLPGAHWVTLRFLHGTTSIAWRLHV